MRTRYSLLMRSCIWLTTIATSTFCLVPAEAREPAAPKIEPVRVSEVKPGLSQTLTPAQWKAVEARQAKERQRPDERRLTGQEMRLLKGRGVFRSKYFAGTMPWHRSLRDVNLCTGNLFKSFTDIQVQPAKGAGLALQRTYNSDDDRIGPFGIGWTHAYDIRNVEENPTTNYTDTTLNYSDREDFFGGEHKYHRDADGLYSPPAYLYDEHSSNYVAALVNGPIVATDDTDIGMDGTVKHYNSFGSTVERVCDTITDRYGNQTVLTYAQVTMPDGTIRNLLQTVTDPSTRHLTFWWSNLATSAQPAYRIIQVDGPQYSVTYHYGTDYNLSSVTLDAASVDQQGTAPPNLSLPGSVATGPQSHSPRTTSFTYTSLTYTNYNNVTATETGLLSSIKDPIGQTDTPPGHTVSYGYTMSFGPAGQTYDSPTGTVWVNSVTEPAGVDSHGVQRTQVWSISTAVATGGTGLATTISSNGYSGFYATVLTDTQLRKYQMYLDQVVLGCNQTQYDSANNVIQTDIVEPVSGTWYPAADQQDTFTYGPHGNVLTHNMSGFSGTETTSYYNASGYFQKNSVTDFNGHTTTFIVGDNTGADPAGIVATSNGNKGTVLHVQDAGYSVSGQPSYQKQFTYTYSSAGQKLTETNLNGVVTQYSYGDQWGNLTQVVQDYGTGKLNRTTSMVYDAAGHVMQSTDPGSQTSAFTYTNLGQPLTAQFPAKGNALAETISYGYDANGRTNSVSDLRGVTTIYYEAGSDRVSEVRDPIIFANTGQDVLYTYTVGGDRLSVKIPGAVSGESSESTWNYTYAPRGNESAWIMASDEPDKLMGQLASITDDQGRKIEYQTDLFGTLYVSKTNESYNGSNLVTWLETDYSYDVPNGGNTGNWRKWLLNISNVWHGVNGQNQPYTQTLASNTYTLDNLGQRLTNAALAPDGTSRTEVYGYDPTNRLTSVNYGDGETQGYGFDAMGNRLSKTDSVSGNESYAYDNANRLLTRGSNSYTNDASGNTLTGGGRTNVWDSENRLISCTYNGTTSNYTYGADGLRRRAVIGSTTTDFVLDGTMQVRELRGTNSYATYLVGARGPEYRRDENSGTVRWYLFDGLGSVLGELDPNGNVTASRKFDVYGGVRSSAGTSTSKHKFVGSLGHPSDDESGLIYMRARYYEPASGRFLSEDPETSASNRFPYCDERPTHQVDSSGRDGIFTDEEWWEQQEIWRNAFLWSLRQNTAFRAVAAAFLVFWTNLVVQDTFAWPGHTLRSAYLVGNLWRDFIGNTGKPAMNPFDVGRFYTGYSACLMITVLLLDDSADI